MIVGYIFAFLYFVKGMLLSNEKSVDSSYERRHLSPKTSITFIFEIHVISWRNCKEATPRKFFGHYFCATAVWDEVLCREYISCIEYICSNTDMAFYLPVLPNAKWDFKVQAVIIPIVNHSIIVLYKLLEKKKVNENEPVRPSVHSHIM